MPTSTQESERERTLLLRSLQEFSRGVGEAPVVTKWTNASESFVNQSNDCSFKEFNK